jgi:hypothetical protein
MGVAIRAGIVRGQMYAPSFRRWFLEVDCIVYTVDPESMRPLWGVYPID